MQSDAMGMVAHKESTFVANSCAVRAAVNPAGPPQLLQVIFLLHDFTSAVFLRA
jgi:hypothetical protein